MIITYFIYIIYIITLAIATDSTEPISQTKTDLFVETLIVIDATTYKYFDDFFGLNLPSYNIDALIEVYFHNILSDVNDRLHNSLANDPSLSITTSLAKVLIITDESQTPWTNSSIVSVPGYPYYGNGFRNRSTARANVSLNEFAYSLKNMKLDFSYDYAVAVTNIDLWGDYTLLNRTASLMIAHDAGIGGICDNDLKYSILEISSLYGFGLNFAHTLAHSFGAIHDGTVSDFADASQCPASDNYIMTPTLGAFINSHNLYYYSNCSINQFKKKLLSSSGGISPSSQCLANAPIKTQPDNIFLAQCFTKDQQCQLQLGPGSKYCNGSFARNGSQKNNDLLICSALYCSNNLQTPGLCLTGGVGILGIGAIDGTSCYSPESNDEMVCYQGQCLPKSTVPISECTFDSTDNTLIKETTTSASSTKKTNLCKTQK